MSAGDRIDFLWLGLASSVTFSPDPMISFYATPGTSLRAQYSAATLIYLGSSQFVLVGDLS
jgi:hypothetical protein